MLSIIEPATEAVMAEIPRAGVEEVDAGPRDLGHDGLGRGFGDREHQEGILLALVRISEPPRT